MTCQLFTQILKSFQQAPATPEDFLAEMEAVSQSSWRRGDFLHVINADRSIDALWKNTDAFHRDTGQCMQMVIFEVTNDRLALINVLCSTHDLTVSEYNEIVRDFFEAVVNPASNKIAAEVSMPDSFESIENHFDAETYRKLLKFSKTANKSSSAFHALDRERWLAFLTSACRNSKPVEPNLLKRWLIDEEGWPGEIAESLTNEFGFAKHLIRAYDNEAQ